MILRTWRGRADRDRPDAYPEHFHTVVVPQLQGVAGFLGAELVRRERGDAIEFAVISRWSSMGAVRAFAGDDSGRAVVEPGAVAALRDFDEFVEHFEVVEQVVSP
jgi:heme-degrading monooxygenase HmoA